MARQVRVLVVDDSAFYRKRIRQCLEQSPEIRVVGEAADGAEAQRLNRELAPDLVTMDVVMPVMDGIEAVRRLMRDRPVPVVMFSSFTREGARATLEALEAGAVDFVPKLSSANDAEAAGCALRERVLELTRRKGEATARPEPVAPAPRRPARPRLLVIGASTGGPMAVQQILAALPGDYPVPILVVIHMPGTFTPAYAERLDAACALQVREAADGLPLRPGQVLVAPGGRQTLVDGGAELRVRVTDEAGQLYRPCLDLTLGSVAERVGADALGVVLTGMGSDGLEGARRLRAAGGHLWAQDEASSVVYGMPAAVARAGLVERVLPLDAFAAQLREIT
ncbi:MAG TPA: chemotaxis response regulator protein-glutamate methylesterase [Gammaproteobacteria bacterium]|nr:chemotaxis response regulator protein-glutamate methylesterase [Gammaproteobacteria bacterium]